MSQDYFSREKPPEFVDLSAGEVFKFHCGPDNPCFNRCCRDLLLPLAPYDVLRLRRSLGISGKELLTAFAKSQLIPETGLQLPVVRMLESPDRECPFLSPAGCSVYEDRPSACRLYPLGRAASVGPEGAKERFLIAAGEFCQGWNNGEEYDAQNWMDSQEMGKYNYFNDRYMSLLSMIAAGEEPLPANQAAFCFLCLYQPEEFRALIEKMNVFSRVSIDEKKRALIMDETVAGDEACLDFAFDWLDLTIFGLSANLSPIR
ncbi:MAG: YkgJ family cysteine cluster protein [Desulfovibrio sp.]|nr:YkgJ family cysteine cluster protein [Desulfovibrio sp.]